MGQACRTCELDLTHFSTCGPDEFPNSQSVGLLHTHINILLTLTVRMRTVSVMDVRMRTSLPKLRGRIAELGVRKGDVARELGMDQALFSRYLNGRQPPPADFERRVTAALDRLEQAERAADKARQKVLKRPVKELGV